MTLRWSPSVTVIPLATGLWMSVGCGLDPVTVVACRLNAIEMGGKCMQLCNVSDDCANHETCDSGTCLPCDDCSDPTCRCDDRAQPLSTCQPVATSETDCADGKDDDCDELLDCDDPDCASACAEAPVETCDNGIDDDGDELVDCDDSDCASICGAGPVESCTNGVDDDGDGQIDCQDSACAQDPACDPWTTVTCSIPNCNGSLGEGEPECWDAPGPCTSGELEGWCTRRVDATLWFQLHSAWVDERCAGAVEFDGTNIYSCRDTLTNTAYQCVTPLVLVFDVTTPIDFIDDDGHADFNLAPADAPEITRTDWPSARTPWLALDRDGDGLITSGEELFGSATPAKGGYAKNGFAALAELDQNHDGVIDARDAGSAALLVWFDFDADRRSTREELFHLADLGITALSVRHDLQVRCDHRGNCERERAAFVWRDARGTSHRGAIVDVTLAAQPERRHTEDRPSVAGARRVGAQTEPTEI